MLNLVVDLRLWVTGITGPDDLQQHGDPYFHYYSIQNILNTVESVNCGRTEILSSETLSVDAGQDYIIPIGTPYELKVDLSTNLETENYLLLGTTR